MKIVFVVGATASGKSALALEIAKKYQGEIANADSVQVYQRVDIGSAKPTQEERAIVPHHLFDLVVPGQNYTAGDYRRDALELIVDAKSRNVPLLVFVGGSGFYIQALINGMYDTPKLSANDLEALVAELDSMGFDQAYQKLQSEDPEYAKTISVNDHYRIQRAFEIMKSSGKTVTQIKLEQESSADRLNEEYIIYGIEMDRTQLRERVRKRIELMLEMGWVDEVQKLIDEGFSNWEPMNAVGYSQVREHLKIGNSKEELVQLIENATMQLAKRQSTWFRNRVQPKWVDPSAGFETVFSEIDLFLGS